MSQNNTVSKKAAGAFDIRNVIGALLGIYGIALIIASFVIDPGIDQSTGVEKAVQDNLWSGLGMLAVAIVFMLWAKIKPIIVVEKSDGTITGEQA